MNIPTLLKAVPLIACLNINAAATEDIAIDLSTGSQDEADRIVIRGGLTRDGAGSEFVDYFKEHHFQTVLDAGDYLTAQVRAYAAEKQPNEPFLISANIRGGEHYGRWIESAVPYDYLNNEMNVVGLERGLGDYLLTRRLTEAVGVGIMVMPDANSNAIWRVKENPPLYGKGVALAYATGAHLHIPWCLYDGSQTERFYGRPDTHAPYFRIVADHPDYFDGYADLLWHELTLPYGPDGLESLKASEQVMEELFERGIPTHLAFDTSAFVQERGYAPKLPAPAFKQAAPYRSTLDEEVMEEISAPTRWNTAYAKAFFPPVVRVSAEPRLTPVVFHVIGRLGGASPEGAAFTVSPDLLDPDAVEGISYITVGQGERGAPFERTRDGLRIAMPDDVNDWAVFRVRTAEKLDLPGVPLEPFRAVITQSEIPVMRLIRFSKFWDRPAWVDGLIENMPPDPVKEFGTTRITWSYEDKPSVIRYAHDNGWAYHGTENISHTLMGEPGDSFSHPGSSQWAQPPDWPGFARDAKGEAIMIRADFDPNRFSGSFAAPEHLEWFLERNKKWVNRGADGVQWDDVSSPMNRIWLQGGDYSTASLEAFKDYLADQNVADFEAADLSTEEIKEKLVEAFKAARPTIFVRNADNEQPAYLRVPQDPEAPNNAKLWLATPALDVKGDSIETDVTFRLLGAKARRNQAFYLTDATGMSYHTTTQLNANGLANYVDGKAYPIKGVTVPDDEWKTLRMKFDLKNSTYQVKFAGDTGWSEPQLFRKPVSGDLDTASLGVYVDPRTGTFDLKEITIVNDA